MASNACFTAFSVAAPVPILHYYGLEDFTMAKRYSFQLCFSRDTKWDVEEFLKDTFPRKKQIILAPYHGRISFFLDNISFEALEVNGLR